MYGFVEGNCTLYVVVHIFFMFLSYILYLKEILAKFLLSHFLKNLNKLKTLIVSSHKIQVILSIYLSHIMAITDIKMILEVEN